MSNDILSSTRKNAYKTLYLQGGIIIFISIVFAITRGFPAAWSAILGGISWLLPSFYFVRKLFIMRKSQKLPDAQSLLKTFYIAELLKLLFSATLIVLFIKLFSIAILPFLSGYFGAVIVCLSMTYVCKNV